MSRKLDSINGILDELENIQPEEIPPLLSTRINNRIKALESKPGTLQALRPILAGGLLVLNGLIIYLAIQARNEQTEIRSVFVERLATEYTLTLEANPFQFNR